METTLPMYFEQQFSGEIYIVPKNLQIVRTTNDRKDVFDSLQSLLDDIFSTGYFCAPRFHEIFFFVVLSFWRKNPVLTLTENIHRFLAQKSVRNQSSTIKYVVTDWLLSL